MVICLESPLFFHLFPSEKTKKSLASSGLVALVLSQPLGKKGPIFEE